MLELLLTRGPADVHDVSRSCIPVLNIYMDFLFVCRCIHGLQVLA